MKTQLRVLSTVVLLALVGALNSWSQGFGNRELINADWYFNLGDIKYGGSEYLGLVDLDLDNNVDLDMER